MKYSYTGNAAMTIHIQALFLSRVIAEFAAPIEAPK